MPTSLLTPSDVTTINALRLDGLATSIALSGVSLVLLRHSVATGRYEPRTAQMVAVKWSNTLDPRNARGEAATTTLIVGEVRAFAPFDVQPDDRFALGGFSGRIVAPVIVKDGICRAGFATDQGSS